MSNNPLIKIIEGLEELKDENTTKTDYEKVAETIKKMNRGKDTK